MGSAMRHGFAARLVVVRNPFAPSSGRVDRLLCAPGPLAACIPPTDQPHILIRNGTPVLRADWQQPVVHGDAIVVVILPEGGGGGGGGKNPIGTVLSLALSVWTGPLAESLAWSLVDSMTLDIVGFNMAKMAIGGAINMATAGVINAVIGSPKAAGSASVAPVGMSSTSAASPTYSLTAQGNTARIDSPIPIQYGRIQSFPDFAAQPYAEFAGNEQYLYQLLCLGVGEFEVEAIRIEDTALSSWEEITYEVVEPNTPVTLFPTAVTTSTEVSGQEAETSTALGPFTANASGTTANRLAIDIVCPRGLYYANDSGSLSEMSVVFTVEARALDDLGAPVGDWVTIGSETLAAATTTPIRKSYSYGVAAGRYEVRLTRTDTKSTDARAGHELDWFGLRAYLVDDSTYGNVTLIAMRARATNNLSQQASRRINVIATRKLPTWSAVDGWSTTATATSSIAWAIADACKTIGLPDSRIDLAGLVALDAIWAARGDEFNGRFDQTQGFWESLRAISLPGRARPYMQSGIIYVHRDAAATLPVSLFSMRNILRGSFSLEFITPTDETADAIEVTYFDRNYWKPQRVSAALVDSTSAKPAKFDLFGVTDRDHAYREGLYMAAANRYRRTLIKFATEMDGFIPSFGDLVAVAHDMPQWGQTAEAVAWDAGTLTLDVTEPLTWSAGTHYMAVRDVDGSLDGPYVVTAGATDTQVVFAELPAVTPYTGLDQERTHVVFGWGDTWSQLGRVVSVKPTGANRVEIQVINEDPSVHTADTGAVAPAVVTSQLSTTYTAPQVAGLTARSMADDVNKMVMSWRPAPGADHYLIEQANGPDGDWVRIGDTTASNFSTVALYGANTFIRVAAVGLTRGPWVTVGYAQLADYFWTGDANPMWTSDSAAMWSY